MKPSFIHNRKTHWSAILNTWYETDVWGGDPFRRIVLRTMQFACIARTLVPQVDSCTSYELLSITQRLDWHWGRQIFAFALVLVHTISAITRRRVTDLNEDRCNSCRKKWQAVIEQSNTLQAC
jgi:hypothetical protein